MTHPAKNKPRSSFGEKQREKEEAQRPWIGTQGKDKGKKGKKAKRKSGQRIPQKSKRSSRKQ